MGLRDPARALRVAVRTGDDAKVAALVDWLLRTVPLIWPGEDKAPLAKVSIIRGSVDASTDGFAFRLDDATGIVRAIRRPDEVPQLMWVIVSCASMMVLRSIRRGRPCGRWCHLSRSLSLGSGSVAQWQQRALGWPATASTMRYSRCRKRQPTKTPHAGWWSASSARAHHFDTPTPMA